MQPGQSFWTIAEGIVRATSGGEPELSHIADAWQQLIDLNADILVDPGNPDLLHVGQRIDLTGLR